MAHVVTDKCNKCKFTDCVEVCPVACFYELDGQVVIQPDDCIDCQACVAECPVEAIYAEGDVPPEFQANVAFNGDESRRLKDSGAPAIVKKRTLCRPLKLGRPNSATDRARFRASVAPRIRWPRTSGGIQSTPPAGRTPWYAAP